MTAPLHRSLEDVFWSKGYIAGLVGQASLPGTYAFDERRAYEHGYDIGRNARLAERDLADTLLSNSPVVEKGE